MHKLTVEIPGHPEPAVRVTKRSLWRGKKYAAWKKAAALLIQAKVREREGAPNSLPFVDITPCQFTMWVYGHSRRADIDNYLKAGLDACVLSGIILNDNCKNVQAAHVYFLRAEKDKEYVLMELESQ